MSHAEVACSYAALILADENVDVTTEKLQTILKAANVQEVEPIWASIFAKALEGKDVKDVITNVGSVGATVPAVGAANATVDDGAQPQPEKKEEKGMYWLVKATTALLKLLLTLQLQKKKNLMRTWALASSTKPVGMRV
ncbi:hypothetical protein KEM55_004997 [Ascosphaera atra]|nr:hypothetical protein KEM55_004997 [Ascosphaera atra]